MRNALKFSMICGCIAAAGIVLAGMGYAMGGMVWGIGVGRDGLVLNSPHLSNEDDNYIQNTEVLENFTDIEVSLEYGDLVIEPSDHFGISYNISSAYDFSAEVTNGCLRITQNLTKHFGSTNFVFFGAGVIWGSSQEEYVKILIPADAEFDTVILTADAGDITGSGLKTDVLQINADYGDVSLKTLESAKTDITLESCDLSLNGLFGKTLTIYNAYGDVNLQNITTEDIAITAESVDIDLSEITASALKLENEYGDINGRTVSAAACTISMESGDCSFNRLNTDNMEIRSEYGDVNLGIRKAISDYTLNLTTDYGIRNSLSTVPKTVMFPVTRDWRILKGKENDGGRRRPLLIYRVYAGLLSSELSGRPVMPNRRLTAYCISGCLRYSEISSFS